MDILTFLDRMQGLLGGVVGALLTYLLASSERRRESTRLLREEILPGLWEKVTVADRHGMRISSSFSTRPKLDELFEKNGADALREALGGYDFAKFQIEEIVAANDKGRAFDQIRNLYDLGNARTAISELLKFEAQHSIRIPDEISAQVDLAAMAYRDLTISLEMYRIEHRDLEKEIAGMDKFRVEWPPIVTRIKELIRKHVA